MCVHTYISLLVYILVKADDRIDLKQNANIVTTPPGIQLQSNLS